MYLSDMKKITVIASLLIVFTACEKADIRPNSTSSTEPAAALKRGGCTDPGTNPNTAGDDSEAIGSGGNPTVDPNSPNPDPNGGDITDPLRKKDQKDNK